MKFIIIITCLTLVAPIFAEDLEKFNPPTTYDTIPVHLSILKEFLQKYAPPDEPYKLGFYDCKHFAKDLIQAAHAAGIEAHLVIVSFKTGNAHAIVGFPTEDAGLIYADATPNGEGKLSGGAKIVVLQEKYLHWMEPKSITSTNNPAYQVTVAHAAVMTNEVISIEDHEQVNLYHTNGMWLTKP